MLQISTNASTELVDISRGCRVYDLIQMYPELFPPHDQGYKAVGALMNNDLIALSDHIEINSHVELIYPDSVIGGDLYRRSLIFLRSEERRVGKECRL